MDGSRNAGLGGATKRAHLIGKIRSEENHVLLLDSGDIFQGTPYFNFFGGELEFKLMSDMGYDAVTIGNHDFDAGLDGLVKQLPHANFPFICSNYNFDSTPLQSRTLAYKTFQFEDIRIGVMGLGIELKGLVPAKLYGETQYLDPLQIANQTALHLKKEEKCHYIICLSHLGYSYRENKIDDLKLARQSSNIDLILGGHTHTFLKAPNLLANRDNNPVTINQVGWAGILLGRLDIYFERNRKDRCVTCQNRWIR
jgi:5'-nucleotidase